MKKLLISSIACLTSVLAFGQGTVTMNTGAGNAYLRFSNTVAQAWAQAGVVVGLYYAADQNTLQLGGGTLITSGGTAGDGLAGLTAAGTIGSTTGGGNRVLPTSGTPVWFQLRAWSTGFASYDLAKASTDSATLVSILTGAGSTPVVSAIPAASGNPVPQIPWNPGSTTLAQAIVANLVPVPEPSTLALVGLGLLGLIFIRRRG